MLCLHPSTGNSVFPTFEPTLHVRKAVQFDTVPQLWLGIDFGFANPFVSLWIRRYENGLVHVIDEYVRPHQTMEYHVSEIRSRNWGKAAYIGCDPAGAASNDQTAKSNLEVLRRAGFKVRTRHTRIIDGLEMIRTALKTRRPNPVVRPPALRTPHQSDAGLSLPRSRRRAPLQRWRA